MFGCGYGCGPCGGGGYSNCGYGSGYGNGRLAAGGASRNAGAVCNSKEIYYEKQNCSSSFDNACCANQEADCCNGWNNGCGSYGNYGGCGPALCGPVGGCGPVGCGPVGCGPVGGCGYGDCDYEPCGGKYNKWNRYPGSSQGWKKGYANRNYATPNSRLHKKLGHNMYKKQGHRDD